MTCVELDLESANKVRKHKRHCFIKSYRFNSLEGVLNFIGNNESLMILGTYMATFGLLVLQGFHINQE